MSGIAIVATLFYLFWRGLYTLSLSSVFDIVLAIGFFSLEAISNLSSIIVMVVLTRLKDRTSEANEYVPWTLETKPSVAVFIATYNEDRTILNRTIIGALNQRFNAEVYVLDDGRRPEIAKLCADRGVNYLTRADNRHPKAGNMNAGLQSLRDIGKLPQFIAILDADFVPLPDFLIRALSLFHDESVGLVQTPQHFFNPDPIQHSFRAPFELPDEQRFFFDTLLAAKDGWNAAFSCGTSSIVRTSSLLAVGGFPTDSITEDMLLSMRLKGNGFRTVYLNEPLSLGLAPEGLSEYCTQRIRWCIGAMQIVSGRDGIFSTSKLTLSDRVNLFDTLLYWLGSFPFRIACLIIPIVYWLTGITVMNADLEGLETFLLPKIIVESFAIAWYSKGRLLPFLTDVSQLLIAPEIILAALHTLLRPGERPFKVTNKGGDRTRTVFHWWMIRRFMVVIVATSGGLIFSYYSPLSPDFFSDQQGIVSFWSIYNIIVCAIGIYVAIEMPRRGHERTSTSIDGSITMGDVEYPVRITDFSVTGAAFESCVEIPLGSSAQFDFSMLGTIRGQVVRRTETGYGATVKLSEQQEVAWISHQFSGENHRSLAITPRAAMGALVRGLTTKKP